MSQSIKLIYVLQLVFIMRIELGRLDSQHMHDIIKGNIEKLYGQSITKVFTAIQ